jgi:hypothetical protein
LDRHEAESAKFIRPQRAHTDLVVRFGRSLSATTTRNPALGNRPRSRLLAITQLLVLHHLLNVPS